MTAHRVFARPRTVREYGYLDGQPIEQPGSPNGFLLPWDAIDDQALAIVERRAPAFVVLGEYERSDGLRFPELAVTTSHIEATTHYRWDRDARRLRWTCPYCGLKDTKHAKGCEWA